MKKSDVPFELACKAQEGREYATVYAGDFGFARPPLLQRKSIVDDRGSGKALEDTQSASVPSIHTTCPCKRVLLWHRGRRRFILSLI